MKLTRFSLVLMVILSLFAVSLVGAQDDEPSLTFTIIEDGETVSNTFEGDVNAHLYVFHASAGDIVDITMIQTDSSLLDPYLVLLGAAGQVYTSDDDGGPEALSSMIEGWEVPEDGTYLILATSFGGLRAGVDPDEEPEPMSYDVSVSGISTPSSLEDPSKFQYFAGQLELGDSSTLEISADEPVYFVTFVAEEGDLLTIETSDDSDGPSIDTLLYLFDPNGNRIAVNDDGEGIGLYSSISNIELPEDGMYMVFATSWDFAQSYEEGWENEGSFQFTIE